MFCKRFLLLNVFFSLALYALGQEQKTDQPTSTEPGFPQQDYSPKKKKAPKTAGPTYNARNNFYDHKEELDKQREKYIKYGNNPQYSDKEYFGHKRLPRKRSASKMKYCKVCGIRH